ncbi:hypothetical protein [Paraherbaspirillum soli]|uniref:Uncharacterized protein n=1 Tax=Paraherbaspirillum soli TaxID=631222 RepID=A0ABW0M594_9BURK
MDAMIQFLSKIKRALIPSGTESISRLPSRRLAGNCRFTASDNGVLLHDESSDYSRLVKWDEIGEIVVIRVERWVGDTLLLVFELREGGTFQVPEDHPDWKSLGNAICRHLPNAKQPDMWFLEAVSSKVGSVQIYPQPI